MLYHILAVGDVVGEEGLRHLSRHLRQVKKMKNIAFAVVNGENIAGNGLTADQAEDLFAAGADVITLGNHTWGKVQIADYLEDSPYILRPANYTARAPGRGYGVYDCGAIRIAVMNLIGRCDLDSNADNPFLVADRLLKGERTSPLSRWWISTPRPPVKNWLWVTGWTDGSALCGAPTPTYPRRMSGSSPRERATSRTWA